MKKVLIVTYYWPPSGGAGVQRWLKTVKYLRDYGWEPVVYTALDPEYPSIDESLQNDVPEGIEVIRQPIWEPYTLYKKFIGQKKGDRVKPGFISDSKKPKMTAEFAVWVRGNFFIPDARKGWIKPSVKFLKSYLKDNPVDAMISTGPPHSMHLIARGVKEHLNIPWIADFRDPWTFIDFYKDLKLTARADRKHKRLELSVLNSADKLVTVSKSWGEDFAKLADVNFEIIHNGYDPADFDFEREPLDEKFSLSHIGALNKDRNSPALWEALSELSAENADFKSDMQIVFAGNTDASVFSDLEKFGLTENCKQLDYMPHELITREICKHQVLLLLLNNAPNSNGIMPGKMYEYMASGRPIFCVGDMKGDTVRVLKETGAGFSFDYEDKEGMKAQLLKLYQAFKNKEVWGEPTGITKYSRAALAGDFGRLLDGLTQ